jgi:hypothetical protein
VKLLSACPLNKPIEAKMTTTAASLPITVYQRAFFEQIVEKIMG